MLFASLCTIVAEYVDNDVVTTYEDELFRYVEYSCYTRQNVLRIDIDKNQICIDLDSTFNVSCNVVPKGVYVDIYLSAFSSKFIRFEVQNFAYDVTTYCADCPDNDCTFFQDTNSGIAYIRSLTREVELNIGKIIIEHTSLDACYDALENEYRLGASVASFYLVRTGSCALDVAQAISVNFELQNDDQILSDIYFDSPYTGVTFSSDDLHGVDEITIARDWSKENLLDYNLAVVYMSFTNLAIQFTVEIPIHLFVSQDQHELMTAPFMTFYSDHVTVSHGALVGYDDFRETIRGATSVTVSLYIFNLTSAQFASTLWFESPSFSADSDDDKTFYCDQEQNETRCKLGLRALIGKDLSALKAVIFNYYFKDAEEIAMGSHIVTTLFDSCWQESYATINQNDIEIELATSGSDMCPFVKEATTEIELAIPDAEAKGKLKDVFSTENTTLTFGCTDFEGLSAQECEELLNEVFSKREKLELLFKVENAQQAITISTLYNNNYSFIVTTVQLFAYICIPIIVVIIILELLFDNGVLSCKEKKKITMKNLDDL